MVVNFKAFDADNHYYEAEDAFIRYMPKKLHKRGMQWAQLEGRKRLLVGGKVNRFIPNPTFNPIARPGCLDQYFRGHNPEGKDLPTLFGHLEDINDCPEYRDRNKRLELMDKQNLEAVFMFPTLGVGMEESLKDDPEVLVEAFRAFNRWLDDDWGVNYKNRIFSAPYITLVDVNAAIEEVEWALSRDARVLVMRTAPVNLPTGQVSLADPMFDPFWSKVNDAGITLAFHAGDSGYFGYFTGWGTNSEMKAFGQAPINTVLSAKPIQDTLAAMLVQHLFIRFPNLRIASIESGSEWMPSLIKSLKKAYGQMPQLFKKDPIELLREHIWVSPYYEDDLNGLKDSIGVERVLFGSDFPHAEGLTEPVSFVNDIKDYTADEQRLVMRDNGFSLIERHPV